MEPSTQLASCLCKECLCHCIVCGRNSTSVCCESCTAELSSPPADTKTDSLEQGITGSLPTTSKMTTPLERVAELRLAIAALEARIQKTPPGPDVRKNADEWETIYLELVALEHSLNIPDYGDRLMAQPLTDEEKKWIEEYEREEDEYYEKEEED